MTTWNDDFTRADENPLRNGPGWADQGTYGPTWAYRCKISSNRCTATNAANCPSILDQSVGNDQFSEITCAYFGASYEVCPLVRCNRAADSSTPTGYLTLFFNNAKLYFFARTGFEAHTQLGTTVDFTIGTVPVVAKATASGDTITAFWRGNEIGHRHDSTYGSGRPGINTWGTEGHSYWSGGDGSAPDAAAAAVFKSYDEVIF